MWTSSSSNDTSEHHSPLSSQPDVVIATAALGLCGADTEHPAAPALDIDRQPTQAPLLNRAASAYGTGATGQGLAFDPALIGPHPPEACPVGRDEVDVGAFRRQRRVKPQGSPALHQRDGVHIIDEDDEVRHTDSGEDGLAFACCE